MLTGLITVEGRGYKGLTFFGPVNSVAEILKGPLSVTEVQDHVKVGISDVCTILVVQ